MPRVVLLALISLSLIAAGCGAGTSAGGDDPASAVPAKAAFYVDATVRPEGDLREDALAAAGKVLRTSDPQAKIDELVEPGVRRDRGPEVRLREGRRALARREGRHLGQLLDRRGRLPRRRRGGDHQDEDEAQSAIDRAVKASDKTFSKREYKGVEYQASPDSAVGIVEGFAVAGTEPEFKQTVDAAKGDGLDSTDRFKKAMDGLEDDRLGAFYLDFKAVLDAAIRQDPESAQQIEQAKQLFPVDKIGAVAGAFMADGERLAIDATAQIPEGALPSGVGSLYSGGATPLLAELPGDSWVAFGAPDFGPALKGIYQQVAGALGGAAIENQLRQELGLDLQQDVFSWIGDVAVFARGTDGRHSSRAAW